MKNETCRKFYNTAFKDQNEIQVVFVEKKISFFLNQKKIHEVITTGKLDENEQSLIKEHIKEYKLNNITVELIELFNGMIVMIGDFGVSIYNNKKEFAEKTIKGYSSKGDFLFFCYKSYIA